MGDGDGDADADGAIDEMLDGGADASVDASLAGTLPVAEIAVGYNHACAIDVEGALYCWGANAFGQLGVGDQDPRITPARVGVESDWLSVAAGRLHSCAVRKGGALYCWGGGAFGQVGQLQDNVLAPSSVAAPSGAWRAVTAGQWHTCGLTDNGQAYCWGYNLLGRLGDGSGAGTEEDPEQRVDAPRLVAGGVEFKAVSAGDAHTCAIDEDDSAWCWGSGEEGRLGVAAPDTCMLADSDVSCALEPVALGDGRSYRVISAGGAHACAVEASGTLWCWGQGAYGQLGIGDPGDPAERAAPVQVNGPYAAVATGASHTCALTSSGRTRCFGDGSNGQLGSVDGIAVAPRAVDLDDSIVQVASGALGSCAVAETSLGYCWGLSAYAGTSEPRPLFQY